MGKTCEGSKGPALEGAAAEEERCRQQDMIESDRFVGVRRAPHCGDHWCSSIGSEGADDWDRVDWSRTDWADREGQPVARVASAQQRTFQADSSDLAEEHAAWDRRGTT